MRNLPFKNNHRWFINGHGEVYPPGCVKKKKKNCRKVKINKAVVKQFCLHCSSEQTLKRKTAIEGLQSNDLYPNYNGLTNLMRTKLIW